ncbi:hypothetical protein HQN60_05700 [Deefgea piscis]|uniref:Uncharacterized protein n=1 Tax=Deefgea piscis TaxID=2739061 RepID=A0A6M8SS26_9NEIS|nr:hypothetical protein [Deefgea piscis]QKJ66250.1 hypothetical protein HQN60_05700 [Deefgea piscis]
MHRFALQKLYEAMLVDHFGGSLLHNRGREQGDWFRFWRIFEFYLFVLPVAYSLQKKMEMRSA